MNALFLVPVFCSIFLFFCGWGITNWIDNKAGAHWWALPLCLTFFVCWVAVWGLAAFEFTYLAIAGDFYWK